MFLTLEDSEVILRNIWHVSWCSSFPFISKWWVCASAFAWGLACVCVRLHWSGGSWGFYELSRLRLWTPDNMWICEPAPVCLSGAGLGLLPFSVSPVTPTGSTNCDTGTHLSTGYLYCISMHFCGHTVLYCTVGVVRHVQYFFFLLTKLIDYVGKTMYGLFSLFYWTHTH